MVGYELNAELFGPKCPKRYGFYIELIGQSLTIKEEQREPASLAMERISPNTLGGGGGAAISAGLAIGLIGAAASIDDQNNPALNEDDASKSGSKSAKNAASHEKYKKKLRQSSEKPKVENPELEKIIDDNYRPNAEIGSGSTADGLRYEKATGKPIKGRMHEKKARDQVDRIRKWQRKNPDASQSDKSAAENILKDLLDALGES